jgi:DNA-binding FadR family transcriptional regulator
MSTNTQQTPSFRRVRKACEQVADQLRESIASGEIPDGDRLPTEAELAAQFGVSRATVREALRILAAQNLVSTKTGPTGGTIVTVPSIGHLAVMVSSGLELLTGFERLTLEELLEARELVEVPAARLAAERRNQADLESMRDSIPPLDEIREPERRFVQNRDFHGAVVDAAGNGLLALAADPIFRVLQTHLSRSALDDDFHDAIADQHRLIAEAIEQGDPAAAAAQMHDHLDYLRPYYERAWRFAEDEQRQRG